MLKPLQCKVLELFSKWKAYLLNYKAYLLNYKAYLLNYKAYLLNYTMRTC